MTTEPLLQGPDGGLQTLYGADAFVSKWVMAQLGMPPPPMVVRAIGVLDGDRLLGGMAFFNWRFGDIEIAAASESRRWLNRRILREFVRYVFVQCECQHVTALIPRAHKPVRKMVERFGFVYEGTQRKAFNGRDRCVYGLTVNTCKVLSDEWLT